MAGIKGFCQSHVSDTTVGLFAFGVSYSASLPIPETDLETRTGFFNMLGPHVHYKHSSNWFFQGEFLFLFGDQINEDPLAGIKNENGFLINSQGFQEPMRYFIRGYISTLLIGKIIPLFGPNKNSGIALCAGAGFMQHKIHFDYASQSLFQLQDDYVKGYDRLSNGLLLKQSIGYINYANNDLINFKIEFQLSQGLTENRRSWDYLEQERMIGIRDDFFYGIGITWFLPVYKRKANDFYLN